MNNRPIDYDMSTLDSYIAENGMMSLLCRISSRHHFVVRGVACRHPSHLVQQGQSGASTAWLRQNGGKQVASVHYGR